VKKLILNRETLVSLSPERLSAVHGALVMRLPIEDTWTDVCGVSARRACISDSPCNTDLTCYPKCYPPVCHGGMSKPGGETTEAP
jgi:hypothetical protein